MPRSIYMYWPTFHNMTKVHPGPNILFCLVPLMLGNRCKYGDQECCHDLILSLGMQHWPPGLLSFVPCSCQQERAVGSSTCIANKYDRLAENSYPTFLFPFGQIVGHSSAGSFHSTDAGFRFCFVLRKTKRAHAQTGIGICSPQRVPEQSIKSRGLRRFVSPFFFRPHFFHSSPLFPSSSTPFSFLLHIAHSHFNSQIDDLFSNITIH